MNLPTKRVRDSVFPVKLFIIYALSYTFITGLIDGPIAFFFQLGSPHPDDDAEAVAMMLAFRPALVIALLLGILNFRRMPIFTTLTGIIAFWLIWIMWDAYWPSFDTDFPNYFDLQGFLVAPLIIALPFVLAYFIWFFWVQRKPQ